MRTSPCSLSTTPAVVDLYARGTDDRLWQTFWNGSSWVPWFAHEDTFKLNSSPAVYSSGPDHRDVYVIGQDRAVHRKWWDGNSRTWSLWESLGGQKKAAPAVVSRKPGHVDVFAVGMDDRLWQNYWNGSEWSGWLPHRDGFPLTDVSVTSRQKEHLDLYVRGGMAWYGRSGGPPRNISPFAVCSWPDGMSPAGLPSRGAASH
jgi:hypothetical protein